MEITLHDITPLLVDVYSKMPIKLNNRPKYVDCVKCGNIVLPVFRNFNIILCTECFADCEFNKAS